MNAAEIFYKLDEADCIEEIGGPWSEPNSSNKVLGQSIYDFVIRHFTKRFLREFLMLARQTNLPRSRPYRCDTHNLKRLIEMRAVPMNDGHLIVEHRLLEVEPLPFNINFQMASKKSEARYLRCSHCNRLRKKSTTLWIEPESGCDSGSEILLAVIHTICADCRAGLVVPPLKPLKI